MEEYRTWFHWHFMDVEWPKNWVLVPILSYLVVKIILKPLKKSTEKLVSKKEYNYIRFEGIEEITFRYRLFFILYNIYDWIKVHFVDRFALPFKKNKAKWPPPDYQRNPAVNS